MAGQTTLEFWQLMLLALGPAAIAAGVAIVSPMFLESRRQEADRKRRRGEKLEELVSAVYQAGEWLERARNMNVFGNELDDPTSPLGRIDTLTNVHFPQFNRLARVLDATARRHFIWTLEARQKRLANDPAYDEGMTETHQAFIEASKQFAEALTSYVSATPIPYAARLDA